MADKQLVQTLEDGSLAVFLDEDMEPVFQDDPRAKYVRINRPDGGSVFGELVQPGQEGGLRGDVQNVRNA
jgi:hypothetical protein